MPSTLAWDGENEICIVNCQTVTCFNLSFAPANERRKFKIGLSGTSDIFRAMDGVSDEDSALVNVLLNEYRTGARFSKFAEPREDSLPNDEYPVRRG